MGLKPPRSRSKPDAKPLTKPLENVRSDVPVDLVTKGEMTTVYFNVEKSIKRRWMAEAFQREMTLTDFITQTMEASLGKGKSE